MSDTPNTLATRLKKRREQLGLTQSRLAINSKTTSMHIMDLESGHANLEDKDHQIAVALRCHPRWLSTGKGDPELPSEITQALPQMEPDNDDELTTDGPHPIQEAIVALGQYIEQSGPKTRQQMAKLLSKLVLAAIKV